MLHPFHWFHLSRKRAATIAFTAFALVMGVEALCAFRLLSSRDAIAGALVFIAWGRDGIKKLHERLQQSIEAEP